ncbi:ferredoxin-dependent glutamate synthase-like [Miscanthus floridulus]|uniref:ferredoxin-dependent glutamate synthase-like n=1 Tax=Miscanthus floridulus TaxID=154761 RepID=UPI0034592479
MDWPDHREEVRMGNLVLADQQGSHIEAENNQKMFAAVNDGDMATEKVFVDEGLEVIGWRPVPFYVSVVGRNAKETMPNIQQIFVKVAKEDNADDIERELYISRKLIERAAKSFSWADELYFCSLSNRTIVYKGMLRSEENLNLMRSRETTLQSPVWRGREHEIRPFGDPKASDSANLDSIAELLLRSGRNSAEALIILVPEAYKNHPTLSIKYPEVINFYDYYKGQMEAWDGPALLLFSDGRTVGATLDRNGLRPARSWRTSDDFVYVASEVTFTSHDHLTLPHRTDPSFCTKLGARVAGAKLGARVVGAKLGAKIYGSELGARDCWSVVGDTDFQTVAGTEGIARTGSAEDTDHGFPGELVLDSSAGNLAGDKHVDECFFQKLALGAFSS